MKQLSILFALCLSIIATSCDNNNDSDNFEQIMTFDQIYTVTGPDSKTSAYPTTQYTYKINHSKGTADIIVKNVRFSTMMPPTTMEFKNLSISCSLHLFSNSFNLPINSHFSKREKAPYRAFSQNILKR